MGPDAHLPRPCADLQDASSAKIPIPHIAIVAQTIRCKPIHLISPRTSTQHASTHPANFAYTGLLVFVPFLIKEHLRSEAQPLQHGVS